MKLLQSLNTERGLDLNLSLADDLRVPKREIAAEVSFLYNAEQPMECLFYLNLYTPRRSGEESLADFLNSQWSFFPLRERSNREFFIVHVNQVMLVTEALPAPVPAGRSLRLFMQSGAELALHTVEPRHAWRARPIDLLNDEERFVTLSRGGDMLVHVNKRHIARVEGI